MAIPFPDIDPVALQIGPLAIRWYSLAYLGGFVLGWRYALYLAGLAPALKPSREAVDNFLPWAVLGVILGGRLGYVLFYQPALYAANPLDALKVWEGGMAFHGGALGVIIALMLYAWQQKIPLLRLSDIVCAVVPIGLFLGRVANFINGELFGRPTDQPWGVIFPAGGPMLRHPSQLYEAILEGLVLFIILWALRRKTLERPGLVTGTFLAGYGAFRLFVEIFREPDAHLGFIIGSASMGQLLSIPMIALGIGVLGYSAMKPFQKA